MAQLTVDEVVELLADLVELGVSEFTWGDLSVKLRPKQPEAVPVEPGEATPPWARDAQEESARLERNDLRDIRKLAQKQGIGPLGFPKASDA